MTSSFKSFLRYAANTAVIIVVVGFLVPSLYRAIRQLPPSHAAITSVTTAAGAVSNTQNIFVITFNDVLPVPTGTCDFDAGGALANAANTCYTGNPGVFYFVSGAQRTSDYIARGSEFSTTNGGSFTNKQIVMRVMNGGSIVNPNPATDIFTITPTNLTGATAVAGVGYLVGCSSNCVGVTMGMGVNNVELVDLDTTGANLDGRDFKVNWTPLGTAPTGFSMTKVYILQSTVSPNAGNIASTGCGGGPCREVGFFGNYQQTNDQLPQSQAFDSNNAVWDVTKLYKACVLTTATSSTLDCSPAMTVVSDTVTDLTAPFFTASPVNRGVNGSPLTVIARLDDEQTAAASFTDGAGALGNGSAQMFHGTGLSTNVHATAIAQANYLVLFSTGGTTMSTGTYPYYLRAADGAGTPNVTVFTATPGTAAASAATDPITVTIGASGTRTVTVNVTDFANASVTGAYVFLGGLGLPGVTSGSGQYVLSNVPDGSYDLTVAKTGICPVIEFINVNGGDVTKNLKVNSGGYCANFGGGGGGTGGAPQVLFTTPPGNVAPSDSIRIGYNTALSLSTVTSANVTVSCGASNTSVGGTVTYCPDKNTPGCSPLFTQDQNTILFVPTSSMSAGSCVLSVNGAVTSATGQPAPYTFPFTVGAAAFTQNELTTHFGDSAKYMPPFVESCVPAPGITASVNTSVVCRFNQTMNTTSLSPTNVKLVSMANNQPVTATISVNSNDQKTVTITPSATLSSNAQYEVRFLGAVANSSGVAMRPAADASGTGFVYQLKTGTTTDSTAPTATSSITTAATNVAVNSVPQFNFSEPVDPSSISCSNITFSRGSTAITKTCNYDPGTNVLQIIPSTVLPPNTLVSITVSGVKDLVFPVANPMANKTITFTTGASDTAKPRVIEAEFDDSTGKIVMSEPMNVAAISTADGWSGSVLNHANITLTVNGGSDLVGSGASLSWDAVQNAITLSNLTGLAAGNPYVLTIATAAQDLSGNVVDNATVNNATVNVLKGNVKSSSQTFGSHGGGGMFGPPVSGGTVGGEFKPQGFGAFTPEQMAFGTGGSANARPFNATAGQDANIFQMRFSPGVVIATGNQFVFTLPQGTDVTLAVADTFSPFSGDMNQAGAGTVTFDTTFDGDGVQVDAVARKVTVQINVGSGTPGANDQYVVDLRGIVLSSVATPVGTSGQTVGVKVLQSGAAVVEKTTAPFYTQAGGTNIINVTVTRSGAGSDGNVFLHGGGPFGSLDRSVTLSGGTIVTAFNGLSDGCYFFGTEPLVTLGGTDYNGQMAPEPVCVTGGQTQNKTLTLTSSSSGNPAVLTVKLAGIANFGGVDTDLFAGCNGSFFVKTITALGVPSGSGYTLNLNKDGRCFVGVGPSMPKGGGRSTKTLPGVPPQPAELIVSGTGASGATITAGANLPASTSFNATTKTLTFTFASATNSVAGTVKDGSGTGLSDVNVFIHQQGFGAPISAVTDSTGAFTLALSNLGGYEICAAKNGLPPNCDQIQVNPDGSDVGTDPDIFFKGKQVTGSNPLVINLKKSSYTISGKVLDASNNVIANAPIFANDANGAFVGGSTDSTGSYILFVDSGVWTVRSALPPDKTDTCGTFSLSVTVTTASQSNQNLTPTAGTCYTLSGTISVGGSNLANVPVFIDEWDTTNDRPAANGVFRPTSTNSSGAYTAKVLGSKTYRIGTFDPTYGELSTTKAVATADVSDANLTIASTGVITFAFTGGTSGMNAFVEVKKSDNAKVRSGKPKNGLDSNLAMTVQAGTYNYFVNVFGIGQFTGSVATGATATINLASSSLNTLSGNIKDGNAGGSNNLAGVLVTAKDTTTGLVSTALTDSSGNYSLKTKPGTYQVSAALSGYNPAQTPANVTLSADTANYDFGGATPDQQAITKSGRVISGTIYKADGSTAVGDGYVTATNTSTSSVISVPINPATGAYSIPVTDNSSWTVVAKAPGFDSGTVSGNVSVTTADVASKNVTLTANSAKNSVSASKAVAADTGGSVDDTQNTGIKINAAGGVLTTASEDVTVSVKKSFTAPSSANYTPLADAAFDISAKGSETIKNLSGNAEIQLNYTSMVASLPSTVTESQLQVVYLSPETGEYVPVEGGCTVDATNDNITCQTNHLTTFSVVYPKSSSTTTSGSSQHRDYTTQVADSTTVSNGSGATTVDVVNTAANTTTSPVANTIRTTIEHGGTLSQPLQLDPHMLTAAADKTETADLTGNATLTLKPSLTATLSVTFPEQTHITATSAWTGDINPPVVQPKSVIQESTDYEVQGDRTTLKQAEVESVISVGSKSSPLTFSAPVSVTMPVSLPDGSVVKVYTSEDALLWAPVGQDYVVLNHQITFSTDHFSYFAVVSKGETRPVAGAATNAAASKSIPVVTIPFVDVANHWSKDFVSKLYGLNVITGRATHFFPDQNITRGELAKMAVLAFGYEVPAKVTAAPFKDVSVSSPYAPYIQVAKAKGIIQGYTSGYFKPLSSVNRAEALKILFTGAKVSIDPNAKVSFYDVSKGAWYYPFVAYAKLKGIVAGYAGSVFRPGVNVTRAEAAKMIVQILEMQ